VLLLLTILCSTVIAGPTPEKPLFKDFIGINGHFTFKPELYSQTCRLVRNYHNLIWDVNSLGDPLSIPACPNGVNWKRDLYGKWNAHGWETDICVQLSGFNFERQGYTEMWAQHLEWVDDYGFRMAQYFGPSGNEKLCTSIEFGNEPGKRFDHSTYLKAFKAFSQGVRRADPQLKIVTATTHARAADDYSLDMRNTFGSKDILPLYDVLSIHTYAATVRKNDSESPWNRSYPEDPEIAYLTVVDEAIAWRSANAPDKEIWITEFGYDCVTPEAMAYRTGWFKKLDWQGTTDLQQAQYLLRSLLVFAERDIQRAYIFFYDDNNTPQVHGGAGLTRKFKPKPSFWTIKQCYETLGDYRFARVVRNDATARVYAFSHGADPSREICRPLSSASPACRWNRRSAMHSFPWRASWTASTIRQAPRRRGRGRCPPSNTRSRAGGASP
jgi:hypothetical protein